MSVLLRRVRSTDPAAASVLQRAGFRADSDIRSLTREDLHELFPGLEKLKLRRTIFGIIHKRKPIHVLLKELQGFVPHDSLRTALTNGGALADYLHVLKDTKTQLNNVQSVIEAHISFLKDISKAQPEQQRSQDTSYNSSSRETPEPETPEASYLADNNKSWTVAQWSNVLFSDLAGVLRRPSSSASCTAMDRSSSPGDVFPYRAQVMYQMVVCGQTFDAHLQLMAKVQAQVQDRVQLVSCSQDGQILIVFCPISSQAAADVDAAMTCIMGDAPVILVSMQHTLDVKHTALRRTLSDHSNVVLHVSVFYHEAERGLLRCQENDAAVSWIQNKLLECSIPRSKRVTAEWNDADRGSQPDSELSFRLFSSSSSSSSSSDSCSKSIWGPGEQL